MNLERITSLFQPLIQMFRDLPLARKFTAISIMLLVGFISLGAAYYSVTVVNSSATKNIASINHFGEVADRINIEFLEMRELEKDFILQQDEALLEFHQATMGLVETNIAEMVEIAPSQSEVDLMEEMSMYLDIYRGSFKEMADTMVIAGLDENSGQLGNMNSSIDTVNEVVDTANSIALEVSLLKMRQSEKNFLAYQKDEDYSALENEAENFIQLLEQSSLDETEQSFVLDELNSYVDTFRAYAFSQVMLLEERDSFNTVALEFSPILETLNETKKQLIAEMEAQASSSQTRISFIFVSIIVFVTALVSVIFLALSRVIRTPLQQAAELSAAIANGELDNDVTVLSNDETGALLNSLKNMQEQLKEHQEQLQHQLEEDRKHAEESSRMAEESKRMAEESARMAEESGRIKQALDGVSSAVLMLDDNLEVIYHNDAAVKMFRTGQDEICKDLPGFDAGHILGKGFDYLYKNANEEGQILRNLSQSQTSEKVLGNRIYRITVTPVTDVNGSRIGIVAEWADRTEENAVEQEVHDIVSSAKSGDLTQRIELQNKNGFFLALSEGVNELVEVAEQVINDTVDVLSGLASGDLTKTMDGEFEGVFAQLKTDVNSTVSKLTAVVREIQTGANSVAKVAGEIATSNAEVSMRTEQQAAALEETASAMEEMTATVRQTASNAHEANNLATEARTQAQAGGEVASQAVTAMNDINEASNRISNIIGVIDEISFQTNLLALNAAVEAARAGEQGRGFAVVANEVRELAGHSANAAKEIKELIEDSNRQVQKGSELVNESGEALNAIVKSVEQVTTIIAEIATASQEQAEGIEQVNASITNMDEGTQQNAAMVEQVTGASDDMGIEADKLNEMMMFFHIGNQSSGHYDDTTH